MKNKLAIQNTSNEKLLLTRGYGIQRKVNEK